MNKFFVKLCLLAWVCLVWQGGIPVAFSQEVSFPWQKPVEGPAILLDSLSSKKTPLILYAIPDNVNLFEPSFQAIDEVSGLARYFFEQEGLTSSKICSELKPLIHYWVGHGVSKKVLIHTWLITKLHLVDQWTLDWIFVNQDQLSKEALEKAPFSKLLTQERIAYLVQTYLIAPKILRLLELEFMSYFVELKNTPIALKVFRGRQEVEQELLQIHRQQPEWVHLKEIQKQKKDVAVRAYRKKHEIEKLSHGPSDVLDKALAMVFERWFEAMNYGAQGVELLMDIPVGIAAGAADATLPSWNGFFSTQGAHFIEYNRGWMNETFSNPHFGGQGSAWGNDETFATSGTPELLYKATLVNVAFTSIGNTITVPIQLLMDEIQLFADEYRKGVLDLNDTELVQRMEESQSLRASQWALDAAKFAVVLIVTRKWSGSKKAMTRPLAVSAGMSAASAIGLEMHEAGEWNGTFEPLRVLKNTLNGTTESLIFMGGARFLGKQIYEFRTVGNVAPERALIQHAQAQMAARKVVQLIDVTEGGADLPDTLRMLDQAENLLQILGASTIGVVNVFDMGDMSVAGISENLELYSPPTEKNAFEQEKTKAKKGATSKDEKRHKARHSYPLARVEPGVVVRTGSGLEGPIVGLLSDDFIHSESRVPDDTYRRTIPRMRPFLKKLEQLSEAEARDLVAILAYNQNDAQLPSGRIESDRYFCTPGTRGYEGVARLSAIEGYHFTDEEIFVLAQHIEYAHQLQSTYRKAMYLRHILPADAVFRLMREGYCGSAPSDDTTPPADSDGHSSSEGSGETLEDETAISAWIQHFQNELTLKVGRVKAVERVPNNARLLTEFGLYLGEMTFDVLEEDPEDDPSADLILRLVQSMGERVARWAGNIEPRRFFQIPLHEPELLEPENKLKLSLLESAVAMQMLVEAHALSPMDTHQRRCLLLAAYTFLVRARNELNALVGMSAISMGLGSTESVFVVKLSAILSDYIVAIADCFDGEELQRAHHFLNALTQEVHWNHRLLYYCATSAEEETVPRTVEGIIQSLEDMPWIRPYPWERERQWIAQRMKSLTADAGQDEISMRWLFFAIHDLAFRGGSPKILNAAKAIAQHPSGRAYALANTQGAVHVVDVGGKGKDAITHLPIPREIPLPQDPHPHLLFDSQGDHMVAVYGKTVLIWKKVETDLAQPLRYDFSTNFETPGPLHHLALSPQGTRCVVIWEGSHHDKNMDVYDLRSRTVQRQPVPMDFRGVPFTAEAAGFLSEEKLVVLYREAERGYFAYYDVGTRQYYTWRDIPVLSEAGAILEWRESLNHEQWLIRTEKFELLRFEMADHAEQIGEIQVLAADSDKILKTQFIDGTRYAVIYQDEFGALRMVVYHVNRKKLEDVPLLGQFVDVAASPDGHMTFLSASEESESDRAQFLYYRKVDAKESSSGKDASSVKPIPPNEPKRKKGDPYGLFEGTVFDGGHYGFYGVDPSTQGLQKDLSASGWRDSSPWSSKDEMLEQIKNDQRAAGVPVHGGDAGKDHTAQEGYEPYADEEKDPNEEEDSVEEEPDEPVSEDPEEALLRQMSHGKTYYSSRHVLLLVQEIVKRSSGVEVQTIHLLNALVWAAFHHRRMNFTPEQEGILRTQFATGATTFPAHLEENLPLVTQAHVRSWERMAAAKVENFSEENKLFLQALFGEFLERTASAFRMETIEHLGFLALTYGVYESLLSNIEAHRMLYLDLTPRLQELETVIKTKLKMLPRNMDETTWQLYLNSLRVFTKNMVWHKGFLLLSIFLPEGAAAYEEEMIYEQWRKKQSQNETSPLPRTLEQLKSGYPLDGDPHSVKVTPYRVLLQYVLRYNITHEVLSQTRAVAISPFGGKLILSTAAGEAYVVDLMGEAWPRPRKILDGDGESAAASGGSALHKPMIKSRFSPDGRFFVQSYGQVLSVAGTPGHTAWTLKETFLGSIRDFSISPEGHDVFVLYEDPSLSSGVRLCRIDVRTHERTFRELPTMADIIVAQDHDQVFVLGKTYSKEGGQMTRVQQVTFGDSTSTVDSKNIKLEGISGDIKAELSLNGKTLYYIRGTQLVMMGTKHFGENVVQVSSQALGEPTLAFSDLRVLSENRIAVILNDHKTVYQLVQTPDGIDNIGGFVADEPIESASVTQDGGSWVDLSMMPAISFDDPSAQAQDPFYHHELHFVDFNFATEPEDE